MTALYEKYRPSSIDEYMGHSDIVQSIKHIIRKPSCASCFLFFGSKGTGKTTLARIFFKMLNCDGRCTGCEKCTKSSDLREIDSSRYRHIDKVEKIVEEFYYRPIFSFYKLYIFDEAHALSVYSFNALLNVIDKVPSYIKIIFITTRIDRIPDTICSRCVVYRFVPFDNMRIYKYIRSVAYREGIDIKKENIKTIVKYAKGDIREALNRLESFLVSSDLPDILKAKDIYKMIMFIYKKKLTSLRKVLYRISDKVIDYRDVLSDMLDMINRLIYRYRYISLGRIRGWVIKEINYTRTLHPSFYWFAAFLFSLYGKQKSSKR
ncbi:AAA family ATPase [Candidatus Vidania fulgoroideorum]